MRVRLNETRFDSKKSHPRYISAHKISTLFWCTGWAWNWQIIFKFASIHGRACFILFIMLYLKKIKYFMHTTNSNILQYQLFNTTFVQQIPNVFQVQFFSPHTISCLMEFSVTCKVQQHSWHPLWTNLKQSLVQSQYN